MQNEKEVDKQLALLMWYKQLKESSNDTFFPLFFDESRYLVLLGGGGSGKSIFAGRKILERVTSESGHRFLICRKVGKTLRDSCFNQLITQLRDHYPDVRFKANHTDMRIIFPATNGEILFSGLDDVEKLKSIFNITGIWIEEASELTEDDFNQLDIRLRGETKHYKQIILSFNPISITHWLKARFFDRTTADATTHRSTYKDNRFLDAEQIKVLESFKNTDEYYYTVYCLGNWGITGKTVFDGKKLMDRYNELKEPVKTGYFEYKYDGLKISDIKFVENDDGYIRIYKEPVNRPYVIGGDTAGEGSDSFALQVLDNTTSEQVAVMQKADITEDEFARQTYCLGKYYGDALIALEVNFSTFPTMELERLRYTRLYVRESIDDYTHKTKRSFGFRTDAKTRPVIIAGLVKAFNESPDIINDKETIEEMMTFIRNPDTYKPEAEEGAHDDLVMSLAIAHYIRQSGQQRFEYKEIKTSKWTKDMKEDYKNADAKGKKYLIEKWGRPE